MQSSLSNEISAHLYSSNDQHKLEPKKIVRKEKKLNRKKNMFESVGFERLLISLFRSLNISFVIGTLLRSTKLLNLIFQKFLIKTHKRSTEMSIMLSTFRHFLFSLNILSAFKCLPLVVVLVLQRVSHLFE